MAPITQVVYLIGMVHVDTGQERKGKHQWSMSGTARPATRTADPINTRRSIIVSDVDSTRANTVHQSYSKKPTEARHCLASVSARLRSRWP